MTKPSDVEALGPATKAREAAGRIVLSRLADARKVEPALAKGPDRDAVHDLRVALRRLRAALQLFGAPKELDREVKRAQDALGRVRDRQLRLDWLGSLDVAGKASLAREERSELAGDVADLARALARWSRTATKVARLAPKLAPKGKLVGKRLRARLEKRIRRAETLLPTVLAGAPPKASHALRIALKKLRYEAELAALAEPELFEPLLETASRLQSLLGDLHDADVRVDWATTRAAKAPGRARTFLAVADHARSERDELARKVLTTLARLESERLFARWRGLVATSPSRARR